MIDRELEPIKGNIYKKLFFIKCSLYDNVAKIRDIAQAIAYALMNGGKVILFGNGGSASDAEHIATEFISKLSSDRIPLPAMSLTANTSTLTALGNDYGFEKIFSRQLEALGNHCLDIIIGISTSGESENVIECIQKAKDKNLYTIGFSGAEGRLKEIVDIALNLNIPDTPTIQEAHIMAGHIICELVEEMLYEKGYLSR